MLWKKSNNSIPVPLPHDRVDYENYGKTLVIRYVDFEDEGQYECEASNGVGVAKSYTMNVEVQGRDWNLHIFPIFLNEFIVFKKKNYICLPESDYSRF